MRYRAEIVVYPKRGISDPEGETLRARLNRKGFKEISEVRSGKYWEIYFDAESRDEAISYLKEVYLTPPMVNPVKDEPKLLSLEEVE